MITYEFKSVSEFVTYLDNRSKEMRAKAAQHHPRSHSRARFDAGAAEIESIAAMVRASNLAAVIDYKKAAKSGAVS